MRNECVARNNTYRKRYDAFENFLAFYLGGLFDQSPRI